MNKNKYVDEIEELSATETPKRQTAKKSSRNTFKTLFIIVLFILCVLGVVRILKLHKEAATNLAEKTQINSAVTRKIPLLNTTANLNNKTAPYTKLSNDATQSIPLSSSITTPPTPVELKKTTVTLTPTDTPAEAPSEPVASVETPVKTPTQIIPDYTLAEALTFKENFARGYSCEADYQTLLTTQHKTNAMQNVLNNLAPYCSGDTNPIANIQTVFIKNKKQALIAGYKVNSPKWIAYMKAILVSTVEIRKLNPQTSKPKDIIYKAQNELYRKNIVQAEKLLRTLPPYMQEQMADFFREASIFKRAENSLNELILSFGKKGE